jgi:hypothetical protein
MRLVQSQLPDGDAPIDLLAGVARGEVVPEVERIRRDSIFRERSDEVTKLEGESAGTVLAVTCRRHWEAR